MEFINGDTISTCIQATLVPTASSNSSAVVPSSSSSTKAAIAVAGIGGAIPNHSLRATSSTQRFDVGVRRT